MQLAQHALPGVLVHAFRLPDRVLVAKVVCLALLRLILPVGCLIQPELST